MSVLHAAGLTYCYGPELTVALPELTLEGGVPAVLTGVSGSGKSTILECLGLIKECTCQCFTLGKQDVLSLQGERARALFRQGHIGFMPQTGGLTAFLSVRDNIKTQAQLALRARGLSGDSAKQELRGLISKAEECADALGISDLLTAYPHQLSVGQRQRASLCRAVSGQPELLLIDEPTAALDPNKAEALFALIEQWCAQLGCCALVVTHDERNAARFACHYRRSEELSTPERSVFAAVKNPFKEEGERK